MWHWVSNNGAAKGVPFPQTGGRWGQMGFPHTHYLSRRPSWIGKDLTPQGLIAKKQP